MRRVAVALLAAALLAACHHDQDDTVRPTWREVSLPAPPGGPGRLMLRDTTACGGVWYVVGAVITPSGDTRPAAWTSADATTWRSIPMAPVSYYGVRSILYAVGCHDGRIAVIGAKAGGAHGNPRVRTWRQRSDGALTEVAAEFLVYGGPDAVAVNRIAGGPKGWLIAGARHSGAAVWRSPDAAEFRIVEGAPNLASDSAMTTSASDALAVPDGWLVAGNGRPTGRTDRDPVVWTSPDGAAWTRVGLPASGDDEAAQRLVRTADGILALGVRGGAFGAWRLDPAGRPVGAAGRFGELGTGVVAGVEAGAVAGGFVYAATTAAGGHRLWRADPAGAGWVPVELPAPAPVGGFTAVSVAGAGDRALVTVDDGAAARAWVSGG